MTQDFNDHIKVIGPDGFNSAGEEGIVYLGDAYNYIKAENNGATEIGTYNNILLSTNGATPTPRVDIRADGKVDFKGDLMLRGDYVHSYGSSIIFKEDNVASFEICHGGGLRLYNSNIGSGRNFLIYYNDTVTESTRYIKFQLDAGSDAKEFRFYEDDGRIVLGRTDAAEQRGRLDILNDRDGSDSNDNRAGVLVMYCKDNVSDSNKGFLWVDKDNCDLRISSSDPGSTDTAGWAAADRKSDQKLYLDRDGSKNCYIWYNSTAGAVEIYSGGSKVFP